MNAGRLLLGLLYISAGAAHWLFQKQYAAIVPDYLPRPRELVLLSGVAAVAGGVGVLIPQTRRLAAWGIIAYLLAVYPANMWMAQHPERYRFVPEWMLWARLPLQFLMMWWAWVYARRASEPAG